jgi:hypothetical protein
VKHHETPGNNLVHLNLPKKQASFVLSNPSRNGILHKSCRNGQEWCRKGQGVPCWAIAAAQVSPLERFATKYIQLRPKELLSLDWAETEIPIVKFYLNTINAAD